MGSFHSNPRRALREYHAEVAAEKERARWNSLTPEEQQAELEQKELARLARIEEIRLEKEKEEKLFNKYMKVANTITIEDFFKSEGPMEARVKVFCTIRGFTDSQTRQMVREVEKLFRATRRRNYKISREDAVEDVKNEINWMFRADEMIRKLRNKKLFT